MPLFVCLFVCLFGDKLLMSSRGVLSVSVFVTTAIILFSVPAVIRVIFKRCLYHCKLVIITEQSDVESQNNFCVTLR